MNYIPLHTFKDSEIMLFISFDKLILKEVFFNKAGVAVLVVSTETQNTLIK